MATVAVAMTTHTTLLPILYGTDVQPTSSSTSMRDLYLSIVVTSISIVCIYYVLVSFCGWMLFGQEIQPNIIDSFATDSIGANILRVSYSFDLTTSVPIFTYALRRNCISLMKGMDLGEADLDKIEQMHYWPTALLGTTFVFTCFVIGTQFEFQTILGFTGALTSCIAAYIAPSLLFARTNYEETNLRYISYGMLVIGIIVSIMATYEEIRKLV